MGHFHPLASTLFVVILSSVQPSENPCSAVYELRQPEDILYLSYSDYELSTAEILDPSFSDKGAYFEEAIICDPVVYFARNLESSSFRYHNSTKAFNASIIPSDITLLNITCFTEACAAGLPLSDLQRFSRLRSLALRGGILSVISSEFLENFSDLHILDLTSNHIQVLPPGVLHPLMTLMIVQFNDNPVSEYHPDLFCNLVRLFSINMNRVFLSGEYPVSLFKLPADTPNCYTAFIYMQILRLSRNHFTVLPAKAFQNVSGINNELQLAGSRIREIHEDAFEGLTAVGVVILDENELTTLPVKVFEHLKNLRQITISHNYLTYLTSDYFVHLPTFEAIDMSWNYLTQLDGQMSQWKDVAGIHYIDASHNNLSTICSGCFTKVDNLLYLLLAHNHIEVIDYGAFAATENLQGIALKHLDLSHNDLESLPWNTFARMSVLETLQLNNNKLSHIDSRLFHYNERVRIIDLSANSIGNIRMDTFAGNKQLQSLSLGENRLEQLPNDLFIPLESLQYLNLSHNTIQNFTLEHARGLKSLRRLVLDHNNITYLNGTLLITRSGTLDQVFLGDNPWNCSCDLEPLVKWVSLYPQKVPSLTKLSCSSPNSLRGMTFMNLTMSECLIDLEQGASYLIIITVLCALLITSLATISISFYFRKEIEVLVFIKFGIRLWKNRKSSADDERHLEFDAFVSFNQEDVKFVTNELMPYLEEHCDPPFKLCVHFRDFLVGVPITENISNAIDKSARTIILLSKEFLASSWCQYEFQQVHYRAMREGHGRLCVILLDDIKTSDIQDKPLRSYIKTHTYLHRNESLFWEKLIFALPQNRTSGHQDSGHHLCKGSTVPQPMINPFVSGTQV